MLVSTLQDVGTLVHIWALRSYKNTNMRYLIITLIGTRKLCSLLISMLMSILQDVGQGRRKGGAQGEGIAPLALK